MMSNGGQGQEEKIQMGTTIMASTFEGGVVLAADTRTSSGNYVANRTSPKLTQLAENAFMCRSGTASDTQAVAGYVQYYIAQHEIELNGQTPVAVTANLVRQMTYNNKEQLSAGIIVAGWDRQQGASVFALPMGGTLLKVPYAVGGSGSAYISGFYEKYWEAGMTEEKCVDFCKRAVAHAFARDGSSGGCVRYVVITDQGARQEYVPHTETLQCYGEVGVPEFAGFPAPA